MSQEMIQAQIDRNRRVWCNYGTPVMEGTQMLQIAETLVGDFLGVTFPPITSRHPNKHDRTIVNGKVLDVRVVTRKPRHKRGISLAYKNAEPLHLLDALLLVVYTEATGDFDFRKWVPRPVFEEEAEDWFGYDARKIHENSQVLLDPASLHKWLGLEPSPQA